MSGLSVEKEKSCCLEGNIGFVKLTMHRRLEILLTGGKIKLTRFLGSDLAGNILFRGSFFFVKIVFCCNRLGLG